MGTRARQQRRGQLGAATATRVASDRISNDHVASAQATGGTSLTAANEDVFVLQPASLGATTSGSFPPGLFFDGSLYGLANNALWGLDVPA